MGRPRQYHQGDLLMAIFSDKELDYLRTQRLARLGTADSTGAPHVVPVGFRVSEDADTIEVGGHGLSKSKKYRDIRANPRVAIVVDDLASVNPWTPRGIEVRGVAELHDEGGIERFGPGGWDKAWIQIKPQRIVSTVRLVKSLNSAMSGPPLGTQAPATESQEPEGSASGWAFQCGSHHARSEIRAGTNGTDQRLP